ncbi:MAG: isoleucine--tRNA ligase [Pseudomonadota bacterium]
MNDAPTEASPDADTKDYSKTLFLPKTEFPMRAGLPKREPEIMERWQRLGVWQKQRELSQGLKRYILHDGPPYANGNIHIGTALNKVLKDTVSRSMFMLGWDANYVPGWDCHGLPIEWKIEEQYRAKGRNKDDVPVNEFRQECREFAEHWIDVQRAEFKRLGVEGDWDDPYLTMSFKAEAQIARELMTFAMSGQLYRGSKPVMWSVVERTALAEAEVEYHDYQSDTIWAKFPVLVHERRNPAQPSDLMDASVVIWTTTPWTIPGNRAISFSPNIEYALYEVASAERDFGPQPGERVILAISLSEACADAAKVTLTQVRSVSPEELAVMACAHPLRGQGYDFDVPLLDGEHVTDEAGTGFVHTAPGHGREDFDVWTENARGLRDQGIQTDIPYTVGPDGRFTSDAPGFEGCQVITDKGEKGDANQAVITALIEANNLFARGRLKHTYPHSWRSKKPVIFRNTPQWFVHMDNAYEDGSTLRDRALKAIDETRFVPKTGQNRLRGMIENRPDWVLSRQRAWGVPITVFVHTETGEVIPNPGFNGSDDLMTRIGEAFEAEGADAWFDDTARERFLHGLVADVTQWEKVDDILDVWFDSGSTHSFVIEQRDDLKVVRQTDGGEDYVLYLEGSDQHRGWFHSSLLESCGTRGRAPYDAVLTHGFVMAEDGRKMSKSLGNTVAPQDVIKQYGADILRLWVTSSDYWDDLRIGPEILKSSVESYRKLRNTLRWMLGTLHHYDAERDHVALADMPELERYMLHRLTELDHQVRTEYPAFDYKRVWSVLFTFATNDLSAFYFDIRKDALYCDPPSSLTRKACLTVLDRLFECLVAWLAPMLVFTAEEAWQARHGDEDGSVHLTRFPLVPEAWRNDPLAAKWQTVRLVRRVVTGALEIERRDKRIGSSLEAAPEIYVADGDLFDRIKDVDWAEVAITSQAQLIHGDHPANAFQIDEVHGVGVVPKLAEGRKCARSWKVLLEVGSDADWPDLSPRDAEAMRERAGLGLDVA